MMRRKSPNIENPNQFRIDWWLVAAILLAVLYFLPELVGLNYFAGIDTSRLNMPLRHFDHEAFASGALPLWNPYMFAGFPGLAESESGVFYPGNIFIHLPGNFYHWYSVEVVAHFIVAAAGFYTWLRMRGHRHFTCALLAMTYSTTPFLIFHITAFGLFTSIVWLPWYFIIYEYGMKSDRPVRVGLFLALFLGAMLMSGSVQSAFLGTFGLVIYAIGVILSEPDRTVRKEKFHKSVLVLLPCILAPAIAAIQLLPTQELSTLSERAATHSLTFYDKGTWLNFARLKSLVMFPAFDNADQIEDYGSSLCYMGIVPFVFLLISLSKWKKNWRLILPLLITGVVTLLLGFGRNLPGYDVLVEFPPFSLFRYPGRMAHVALTMFLTISAVSFDSVINSEAKSNRQWSMVAKVLLILSLIAQVALTYPFSRILVQDRENFEKSLSFFDEIKTGFPTDSEIPRVLQAGSISLMDPDALNKLGLRAQENIWDNMSGNASGLGNVTALNGLTPLNQNDWKLVLRDTLQSRIDAVAAQADADGSPKIPDQVSLNIIKMLGADVLLLEGDDWEVPGYELWKDDLGLPYHAGLCAYRAIDGNVPDAYFARKCKVQVGSKFPDFLRWIGDPDRDMNTDVVYFIPNAGIRLMDFELVHAAVVNSRSRGVNRMRFDVSVDGQKDEALLVTGENYYPGWKAYIDGFNTKIARVNYLMTGVFVPAGDHTVELKYEPDSVKHGFTISGAGLFIWAILLVIFSRREPKSSGQVDAG